MDLVGGIHTPLKNMNVNWDDDIPNRWKNKIHVPNHQPVFYFVGKVVDLFFLWLLIPNNNKRPKHTL